MATDKAWKVGRHQTLVKGQAQHCPASCDVAINGSNRRHAQHEDASTEHYQGAGVWIR